MTPKNRLFRFWHVVGFRKSFHESVRSLPEYVTSLSNFCRLIPFSSTWTDYTLWQNKSERFGVNPSTGDQQVARTLRIQDTTDREETDVHASRDSRTHDPNF
jgi:hypothetical protein